MNWSRTEDKAESRPEVRCGRAAQQPVYAERYLYLTTREQNRLKPTQAQSVIAAAIVRQLHAVVVTRTAWDPDVARNGLRRTDTSTSAAA